MDIDTSGWILEFLLQQNSLDNRLLNALIRVLPLPNNNTPLKKRLILRKINSDVENGTISERTLEFLEQIEELDHTEGNSEVSEAMKDAYCAVAVHCTTKCIEETADDKKGECLSAVSRVWRARVRKMERFGFVSDDLSNWMDDIEAGVRDVSAFESILGKYKGLDVFEVVRGYVNVTKEKMGPSFLESAAAAVLNDDALREVMGLGKDGECDDHVKDGAPIVDLTATQDVDANVNNNSKDNETCKANVPPRGKHFVTRHSSRTRCGTQRGAKIVDTEAASPNKYDSIPTPEVKRVQEALETSTFELNAAVKDPLSNALRVAQCFKASLTGKNTASGHIVGNSNAANMGAPSSSHDKNSEALQANRNDLDDGFRRDQNKRPSLMERNITAHSIEWSDSIEDSSEKGSPARAHLPSPKKRAASPLKMYEIKKLTKMRKKKRWTVLEEDTLRAGVQKYGRGNWKLILNMYRDIFEDRTEVDLKDKWRNLTR